jgi:hypothetical protein
MALNTVMLNACAECINLAHYVIMLSVIMLSVVMLSVMVLSVFMLNVVILNVVAPVNAPSLKLVLTCS